MFLLFYQDCANKCLQLVVFAEFCEAKIGVVLKHPAYGPLAGEDKQVLSSEVLNPLCVVRELQGLGVEVLVFYPAYLAVSHV